MRGATARDSFRVVGGECASPGARPDSRRTFGRTSALPREPALESCQGENAEKVQRVPIRELAGPAREAARDLRSERLRRGMASWPDPAAMSEHSRAGPSATRVRAGSERRSVPTRLPSRASEPHPTGRISERCHAESRERRTESAEPRTRNRQRRAESAEPRAPSRERRAESAEPRAPETGGASRRIAPLLSARPCSPRLASHGRIPVAHPAVARLVFFPGDSD